MLNVPLTSFGNQILDATGQPVRLAGVNWGGAHQDNLVPSGLDRLHRNDIAARIASMGFNHVRFPFALGGFAHNDGTPRTDPVPDPRRLAANPDLQSSSPWQVYVACVNALTEAGIGVIPNQHLLFQGICCSDTDGNGLWWNSNWPVSTFMTVWGNISRQFSGNQLVIGYDLHNEPRSATIGGVKLSASWGDGNPQTDLRMVYHDTIGMMRIADPNALYFCEGASYAQDLTKAGAAPVGTGPGTVYSIHDYSWFGHPAGQTYTDYAAQMDANSGYIVKNGQAPIWVSEFGTSTLTAANMTTGWMANFLRYIQDRKLHWCWWQLNALTQIGHEPQTNILKTNDGDAETFGLMAGQDWQGQQADFLNVLRPLMTF